MLSPIASIRFSDLPRIALDVLKNQLSTAAEKVASASFTSRSYASKHPFKATAIIIGIAILASVVFKIAQHKRWKSDVHSDGPSAPKSEGPKKRAPSHTMNWR